MGQPALEFVLNGAARGLLVVFTFGFTLLGARTYRGVELDEFVLFQVVLAFASAVTMFGLHDLMIREGARVSAKAISRSALTRILLIALVLGAVLVGAAAPASDGTGLGGRWFRLAAVSGLAFAQIRLITAMFRGLGRRRIFLALQGILLAVPYTAGITYMLVTKEAVLQHNLELVASSFLLAAGIAWLVVFVVARGFDPGSGVGNTIANVKTFAMSAGPMYAQSLLGVLVFNADVAVLAAVAPVGVVGVYGVVSRLVNAIGVFREVFAVTVLPNVVRMVAAGDYRTVTSYTLEIRRLILGPLLVVGALAILASYPLVAVVFGEPNAIAALLFGVLMLSHASFIWYGSTDHILIAFDLERLTLLTAVYPLAFFLAFGPLAAYFAGPLALAAVVVIQRNLIFLIGRRYLLRRKGIVVRPLGVLVFPSPRSIGSPSPSLGEFAR